MNINDPHRAHPAAGFESLCAHAMGLSIRKLVNIHANL
jgi:hypothetical protein